MSAPTGVLFVCYANMCRSPLAEGLFRNLARLRGLEGSFRIESAGTHAMDGSEPHPLSARLAAEHGFTLDSRSRGVRREDFDDFDVVVAMDRSNFADLERWRRMSPFAAEQPPRARVELLRAIADPTARGADLDVPDPVAGGPEHYRRVYALLERGCTALLERCLAQRPA